MVIDGVSQSTWAERLVDVEAADGGVRLVIRDRIAGTELGSVIVPADALMSVLAEQPAGPQTIAGRSGEEERVFEVEVRKNEVLLAVGPSDAAVGLDDLMDAVAGALPST